MKPLGKNVLVQQESADEERIILLNAPEKPPTGTVVAIGSLVTELSVGDSVLFTDTFSSKSVPGHEGMLVMHEDLVILVL